MFRRTLQSTQLLIITMGLFCVVALTAPATIFAQGGAADNGHSGGFTATNPGDRDRQGIGNVGYDTQTPVRPRTPDEIAAAAAATTPADTSAIDLGSPIYNMLFAFVVTVFGKLFSWSGALFDMGLSTFVLGFGDLYYNQNIGVSVEEVWKIIRDLFNLTFIFGLVMIGFKMILDSNDSKARSTLVSLIGAALLVNFSLFITKFVIDIANVTASVVAKGFGDVSIANGFINLIKISTFLNIDSTQIAALQTGGAFGYIFGLLIFFAVAAFVFAAGGILMIIRFVVLCAYMVFSPVMFIGWVFPSLGKHSSKYWSGFLGQAFFAPAYLLMLYLSFKVMASYRDQIGVVDYGQLFASGPELAGSAARVIPFFVMTMVFLVMSLVVAKNMGAVGASTAISIGDKLRKTATGGMTSFVGRNTIGRASEWAGKKNDQMEGSRTGRNFKRALSVASLGTFTERERRNTFKGGKEAKFGGSYSRSDDKKFATEVDTTRAAGRFNSSLTAGLGANPLPEESIAFEQAISHASTDQLITQLKKHDSESPEYAKIVQAMSHSQVTKLLESKDEDLSPSKRAKLGKARGIQVEKRLISDLPGQPGTAVTLPKAIAKASVDDLAALGYDRLKVNAQYIPAAKMDDLKSKLTPTEHGLLTKERNDQLVSSFAANPNSVFQGKKDNEVARLPKDILIQPAAVIGLNQRVLEIILRENYLESTDRNRIRNNVTTMTGATSPMTMFLKSPIGSAF